MYETSKLRINCLDHHGVYLQLGLDVDSEVARVHIPFGLGGRSLTLDRIKIERLISWLEEAKSQLPKEKGIEVI